LSGKHVLVVEDQYFIADDLRRMLADAGANVVGPVSSADQAMDMISGEEIDFALLDINLGDGNDDAYPVAGELHRRNIPFAFVTGYSQLSIPTPWQSAPHIVKPFHREAVIDAVAGGLSGIPGK
jgi:two-component SAPR family response regulator